MPKWQLKMPDPWCMKCGKTTKETMYLNKSTGYLLCAECFDDVQFELSAMAINPDALAGEDDV